MAKPSAIKNTKNPLTKNSNVFMSQIISVGTALGAASAKPIADRAIIVAAKVNVVYNFILWFVCYCTCSNGVCTSFPGEGTHYLFSV